MLIKNGKTGEDRERLETYNSLIGELSGERYKTEFANIRDTGFPMAKISRKLWRLFPSLTNDDLKKDLKHNLENIYRETLSEGQLEELYRWFSQIMHANPLLITNMCNKRKSKRHILRCVPILFFVGLHILNFTNKEILAIKDEDMQRMQEKAKESVSKLFSHF